MKANSLVTDGLEVSVETMYLQEYSNPLLSEYLFSYKIKIYNQNKFAVQLLRRKWQIFDSKGCWREVEGEGVLGMQPIILADDTYEYVSGCNLKSEMGIMKGTYEMCNLNTRKIFNIVIPKFEMIAPAKNN